MVKIRVDGQPITFSGQVVAFGAGIQNVPTPAIFTDTNLRANTVTNPNPTTDFFYANLTTGALPRRDKQNITDRKVEVDSVSGQYSPILV